MSQNDMKVLLLPPWKLLIRFLLVTILLLLGTAYSGMTLLTQYLNTSPEWLLGILFSVGVVFCLLNFKASRGSFICTNILKYYALFLAFICLPSFFVIEGNGYHTASAINMALMLFSFFLIKGQKYQELIQYQYNFFKDIKSSRLAIKNEITKSTRSNKI
ncbi:hypothetical protein [Pseudoalteromonas sp. SR43-5]|uniref:hypothetical protein n=1 Tax=Pseudoalteromonas sp. SR43-5 TaxID=2760941 RepID=UPI0015F92A57|nr:hypothetical protein [Pseudoalteromonas sp. SR43-5]MBB1306430.1 hypothetical protein [Pseudoalteromonas sp. SR43-5]